MTVPVDGISDYEIGDFAADGETTAPTFTAATSYHRYRQQGKTVTGFCYGTFATAGEGIYGFTLPVTPLNVFQVLGNGAIIDGSDNVLLRSVGAIIHPTRNSSAGLAEGSVILTVDGGAFTSGSNPVGAAVPFAFGAGDVVSFGYTYEAD